MTTTRCRHQRTWVMFGGRGEWCYECGAYRDLVKINGAQSKPISNWIRPVGKGGKNPFDIWMKSRLRREKKETV